MDTRTGEETNGHTNRRDERTHEQGGRTDTQTGGTNRHTNREDERTHERIRYGQTDRHTHRHTEVHVEVVPT